MSSEVHVGEIVRWEAPGGERVRVSLDRHPAAHEVMERAGDVRAVFLRPGLHSYTLTVVGAQRSLRGFVFVKEPRSGWERALDCEPESSDRICFTR